MKRTDRHCRYFHRLLSPSTLLYTEMVTTGALLRGDAERFLKFNRQEHPVALQLGGSDPEALAQCAVIAQEYHYDEVNLNCGCPSARVQSGAFGARLMSTPDLAANCVAAMVAACDLPVTLKCRTGVDARNEYEDLRGFTEAVTEAGCQALSVHARKAWLKGLSPRENRNIPPLDYEPVYQLKNDFPDLAIVINGGIDNLDAVKAHLTRVDGVMMGRAAYHSPWLINEAESQVFQRQSSFSSPLEALDAFLPYIGEQLDQGVRLNAMLRQLPKASDDIGFDIVRGADGALDSIATLEGLQEALPTIDDVDEKARLLQKSFGDEGKKALLPLLAGLDDLKKNYREVNENAASTFNEGYQRRMKSASGQWLVFTQNISMLGTTLAGTLLPAISAVITPIAKVMGWVAAGIEKFPVIGWAIGGLAAGAATGQHQTKVLS